MKNRNLKAESRALGEKYLIREHRLDYQIIHLARVPLPSGWNRYETEVKLEVPVVYPYEEPIIKIPQGLMYKGYDPQRKGRPDNDGWCLFKMNTIWRENYTLSTWMKKFLEEIESPVIKEGYLKSSVGCTRL